MNVCVCVGGVTRKGLRKKLYLRKDLNEVKGLTMGFCKKQKKKAFLQSKSKSLCKYPRVGEEQYGGQCGLAEH